MLEELKKAVYEANLELNRRGLVLYTWGNVSGIDKESKLVVIKPSGVKYEEMSIEDMVVIDLDGNIIEGKLKPSSDAPTHLEIYKSFPEIGGVAHTHSSIATSFAQAGKDIVALGTTHADYFYGNIPCTRYMKENEINGQYEKATGKVIVETLKIRNSINIPAILVREHGPFTWGKSPEEAVYHSVVLEEVSKMAFYTQLINPQINSIQKELLDKHYLRKHGKNAYYGQ